MELRLVQLEVLTDQNCPEGRAAAFELCALSTTLDYRSAACLSDAESTNSNYSDITAKNQTNSSQIYLYSNRL
jgi:hypothetical protein